MHAESDAMHAEPAQLQYLLSQHFKKSLSSVLVHFMDFFFLLFSPKSSEVKDGGLPDERCRVRFPRLRLEPPEVLLLHNEITEDETNQGNWLGCFLAETVNSSW